MTESEYEYECNEKCRKDIKSTAEAWDHYTLTGHSVTVYGKGTIISDDIAEE